jgi:hypothetical protein
LLADLQWENPEKSVKAIRYHLLFAATGDGTKYFRVHDFAVDHEVSNGSGWRASDVKKWGKLADLLFFVPNNPTRLLCFIYFGSLISMAAAVPNIRLPM